VSTHPELAVGAIVTYAEQLLLIRRGRGSAQGRWSVPGGRVELGETVAEAVTRELLEETGLEGVCGRFIGWTEILDEHLHAVVLDFEVGLLEFAEPVAGDDAAEARWVPLGDVAGMDLVSGMAEFLAEHHVIDTIV
jgi:ADP-ribose pyrophosphatase YjhB (NUDIX family)